MSNGRACNKNLIFKAEQLNCSDIIQHIKIELLLLLIVANQKGFLIYSFILRSSSSLRFEIFYFM